MNEFKLRYPLQLHLCLKEAAANNGVSLNTEITRRLDKLLSDDEFMEEVMVSFIKSESSAVKE